MTQSRHSPRESRSAGVLASNASGLTSTTLLATALVLASTTLGSACANPSVIEVTVSVREDIGTIDTLRVIASDGDERASATFDVAGRTFPLTFTLTLDGREGDIDVELTALDSVATPIGFARAKATVASGAISLAVQLEPSDFLVNTVFDGSQRSAFRPGRNGRALSATSDGFVVTFVNDCTVASSCDVFVRRFDELGRARTLGGSSAELSVNSAAEPRVSVPAVAVSGAGEIGIVWETDDAIRFSRFDAAGTLVTTDQKITAATVENPVDPAIVGLSGGFQLSWFQENDTPLSAGIQRATITAGSVGLIATERAEGSASTPAMAGDNDGLLTAWTEGPDLLAALAPAGTSGTPAIVAQFSGEFVGAPQVAQLSSGFVISYGRQSDGVSQGQMLTLLDATGARVRDVIIAETSDRPTDRPSVAVDDENRIAVVWTACDGEGQPDGSGCGILMQLFDADLSPLTQPTVINTTTIDDQFDPAVVATTIGYAVVWTDNSGALPDESIGLRGRVVFIDALL